MKFRNHLLSAMSEPDIAWLFPHMYEISLRAGATLYDPGDPTPMVYFPSSAVLSAVTVMSGGECVETATVGCEGMVGLMPGLTGSTSPNRVFAQIGGGALRLPSDLLRQRCRESDGLMQLLLRSAQADIAEASQSVACNALHDAPARLARWLLLTEDRVGNPVFPLTQDYMAIMVGVQRTTISAIAIRLKTAGLVRYSRGMVEVVDRAGLEAVACECYGAVRERYAALGIRSPEVGDD
jgi:CRP-like cAMP-binding protein